MDIPYLNPWTVLHGTSQVRPSHAPLAPGTHVGGTVFGHPTHDEGTDIVTTAVVKVHEPNEHGRIQVDTKTRSYLLGEQLDIGESLFSWEQ